MKQMMLVILVLGFSTVVHAQTSEITDRSSLVC